MTGVILVMAALLASPGTGGGDEATVRATVDAVKIGEGETVSFTVEVNGSDIPDVEVPDLTPLRDFTVAAGPRTSSSTSMIWRGGGAEVTSSRKYTYALLPRRIGTLTIPALEITVGGRVHRTRSIQVEVVKGTVRRERTSLLGRRRRQLDVSEAEVFINVELDRKTAYVGQQVLLTTRIYTQATLAALPQPTDLPSLTGFWVEEIPVDPRATIRKKVIRGKEYSEITLMKKALFPTRSGELSIEEMVYQVPVSVSSNDPFDRLLNPSRTIYRRAPARTLTVLPLPEEGRPDSFRGAVGRFSMEVKADRTEASVNDAVGITVEVSGDGNLTTLSGPVVAGAPDYRRFDPKVSESRVVQDDRLQGSKEWSYVFVPLAPGEKPIPDIRFSYFDPVSASYRELQSPHFIISVSRGQATAASPGPGGVRREVVAMREDIRYIKPATALAAGATSFHRSGWFYLLLLLPIAGNAALFAHLRWRDHMEANSPFFRRRRATRRAIDRLHRAGRLAASADEVETFYDEVDRALTGFIADKFNVAASGLTRERIALLLEDGEVPGELRESALACLDRCDMGRFSPGGTGRENREELVARSRDLVSRLERSLGTLLALSLTLLLAACSGGGGGGALQARFEAGNKAYESGEYEKAVDIYRELSSAGLESTGLHYNLGNALFKTGRLGEAILEYERSLRLSPGDGDSRENLEYLRTLTVDEIVPANTPLNALGITYVLGLTSPGQDAAVLAVAWLAAGVAFGVGMAGRGENLRRTAFYAAGALALPALLAGASLGTKTLLSASVEYGVVLAGEVEVLSGAGEENPALFTVHEGLKVRVRSRAGRWVQVSLENGLTGWLPEESFETI